MAAQNEETQTEAQTPPAATPAAKPKGSALPLLIAVILIAAGGGFAVGDLLVAPNVHLPKPAPGGGGHAKDGKAAKASVFRIDNVVVNPAGSEGSHFLMASIAISVPDDKALDRLRENDPQVRDMVTGLLESKSLPALTRPGMRDSLKLELANLVRPIAGANPRVYLPHFVIQ